jgi:hypothetical protein
VGRNTRQKTSLETQEEHIEIYAKVATQKEKDRFCLSFLR